MNAANALTEAIRNPKNGDIALMPYLTAGFPDREAFADLLQRVSVEADVIELGVPFSDPMADGMTIQASSHAALEAGVSVRWILSMLDSVRLSCPVVLMSYLNPLLAYGLENLVADVRDLGVHGFIVPDLPFEEGAAFRGLCEAAGLARVQLVTPVTPEARLRRLCEASGGFVYAVTVTGTTGGQADLGGAYAYLDRVRGVSPVPVCAGFGIATAEDVAGLRTHADGAVVGSALIRSLAEGGDGAAFVRGLRTAQPVAG